MHAGAIMEVREDGDVETWMAWVGGRVGYLDGGGRRGFENDRSLGWVCKGHALRRISRVLQAG